MKSVLGDEPLPLGNPPVLEHPTATGVVEVAQRLIAFPFTPPDVKLKQGEALSSSNDWFTKHDKNKIDQLDSLDFYASSGPQSVGVVPKLHNTSAGVESRGSLAFTCRGCSAILLRCHPRLIGRWMFKSSRRSETRPGRPAIQVARKLGLICELW